MTDLSDRTVVSSAPGKVLLFGEHAVVYGKTAVACAIELRTTVRASWDTSSSGSRVSLFLPSLSMDAPIVWTSSWLESVVKEGEDDSILLQTIEKYIENLKGEARVACKCVLFLFFSKLWKWRPSITIEENSELPIGAGLGSSASFAVAISAAFLRVEQKCCGEDDSKPLSRSDVNHWAFELEKIVHGKPSGVDNTISTQGGLLLFSNKNTQNVPKGFAAKLLIINTRVSRNTKKLVSGVREKMNSNVSRNVLGHVMDAIDEVSKSAVQLLSDQKSAEEMEESIGELMRMNHSLLNCMGVGHEKLEEVVKVCSMHSVPAKLTGAGGGGCAVALIPSASSDDQVEKLRSVLHEHGFESYECALGAEGVKIMNGKMKKLQIVE